MLLYSESSDSCASIRGICFALFFGNGSMSTDATMTRARRVPSWNLEPALRDQYEFDVKMLLMETKKQDRYVCAPVLIRHLGERAKAHVLAYPDLAYVDTVTEAGECTGWSTLYTWLCSKANLTTVSDVDF